jgi:thymidine kinase
MATSLSPSHTPIIPDTTEIGWIELILGPMFSGKTTELMRRLLRYKLAKMSNVVIKYSKDTRYTTETKLATHDNYTCDALSVSSLAEAETMVNMSEYRVIGIDEFQFLPDVVEFADKMANSGKIVIAAGLDSTFQRKPFGNALGLMAISEFVTKLSGVCTVCYKEAAFSRRLGSETAVEVIGGADKYEVVCRKCYILGLHK